MVNSNIPIRWKIHCIDLADVEMDGNSTRSRLKPMHIDEYMKYYNNNARNLFFGSDIGVLVKRDLGKVP